MKVDQMFDEMRWRIGRGSGEEVEGPMDQSKSMRKFEVITVDAH